MKTYAIMFAVAMIFGGIVIVSLCRMANEVVPRDIAAEIEAAQR